MSESLNHNNLVKKVFEKVKNIIPETELCFLKADLFECEKPSLVYGSYIPDVAYCNNGLLIIGEAKTLNDYNTEHSYSQYESYFHECKLYPGNSIIIICLPWNLFLSAQNHFKLLKRKYDVNTKVIIMSDNGWEKDL